MDCAKLEELIADALIAGRDEEAAALKAVHDRFCVHTDAQTNPPPNPPDPGGGG